MSRRRWRRWAVAPAIALAPFAIGVLAFALAPFPAVSVPPGKANLRGYFHVHTVASHDGYGTLEDAALAARRAGGSFLVVTEHNVLALPGPAVVEGVLVVPGVEISAEAGHVVALGLDRLPEDRGAGVLEAIRDAGGHAVLAHPVNRRRPWNDPSPDGFAGFEGLSLDSAFREAMGGHPTRIARALLALGGDRRKMAALLMHRPDAALRRYDEIASRRPVAMMCGVDAHGLPPYEASFGALALHLHLPEAARGAWGGDPAADAAAVVDAIREARTSCSVPALGDATSFELRVEGGEVVAEVAAEAATLVLFRGGEEVARGRGPRLALPADPGAWRVEVFLDPGFPWGKNRLWIASSSLHVPLTTLPEGS